MVYLLSMMAVSTTHSDFGSLNMEIGIVLKESLEK